MSETAAEIAADGPIVYGNAESDTLVSWNTSTEFYLFVGDGTGEYVESETKEVDDIPETIEEAMEIAQAWAEEQ